MAGSIERRVARLEATTYGGDRCPECGNGPHDDKRPYEIVFVDPGAASPEEWCQTCGRALSLTIHMDWEGPGA
jgi:hypothetical protein